MMRALIIGLLAFFSVQAHSHSAAAPPPNPLNQVFPEIKFDNVTLIDTLDALRDLTGANIHVNWSAIEPLGVTRESLVSIDLRKVSLRTVLNLILRDIGKGQLTFYLEDRVIEITARTTADEKLYTRVYFVGDLLMEIPNFEGSRFGLNSGSGGDGANRQLIEEEGDETTLTKSERAEQLISLITDTIRPDIWRQNGGQASIRYLRDHLIISAPRSVHELIGGPLP